MSWLGEASVVYSELVLSQTKANSQEKHSMVNLMGNVMLCCHNVLEQ